MSRLDENFRCSGSKKQEFFEQIDAMDAATKYIVSNGIKMHSFVDGDASEIQYEFSTSCTESSLNALECGDAYHQALVSRAPVMVVEGSEYFCTNRAVTEIFNANSIHGSQLMMPCKERDKYAEVLSMNRTLTYIVRSENGVSKVMSVRTGKYHPIPLGMIRTVLEGFLDTEQVGCYTVSSWEVTQDVARIFIEFPDLVDEIQLAYPNIPVSYVPGIILKNGTTGYATMSAEMYYRKSGATRCHIAGSTAAKHFKAFDPNAFVTKVRNEVWGKYTQMPEVLNEAATKQLTKAEALTYASQMVKQLNIKKVFQGQVKYTDSVIEAINNVLDNITTPTEFDVIDAVMTASDRVNVPDSYRALLEETLDKAWTIRRA